MSPPRRLSLLLATSCAAALAASLVGCAVKAKPTSVWTLRSPDAAAGGVPAARADAAAPRLGITRFTAAPELRTTSLTWRDANGYQVHTYPDQWVDYPDRMLQEMAVGAFLRSGRFAAVVMAPPDEGLDAVLSCRLVDFTELDAADQAMEVRVTVRWQLARRGGETLGSGEAAGRASVAERSVRSVVEAYGIAAQQALAQLVDAVANATPPMAVPRSPAPLAVPRSPAPPIPPTGD